MWIKSLLRVTDHQIFSTAGMDALVYVSFFKLCLKLFSIFCISGVAVTAVNATNGKQAGWGFLESLSIANVPSESKWLWVHTVHAWFVTVVSLAYFHKHYMYLMRFRHEFLKQSMTSGAPAALFIQNLPPGYRDERQLTEVFERLLEAQAAGIPQPLDHDEEFLPPSTSNGASTQSTKSGLTTTVVSTTIVRDMRELQKLLREKSVCQDLLTTAQSLENGKCFHPTNKHRGV